MTITRKKIQGISKRANQSARDKAKASSAPLYYISDGKYIREDADGKKHIMKHYQADELYGPELKNFKQP